MVMNGPPVLWGPVTMVTALINLEGEGVMDGEVGERQGVSEEHRFDHKLVPD